MPRAGWAIRQIENIKRDVESWPRWMRREAGFAEERIYIVHVVGSRRGDKKRYIGIIAFDKEEAQTKIVGQLLNGGDLREGRLGRWAAVDSIELREVRGFAAITLAVYVLQQAGIQVYEIHQDGKKEDLRACPAQERIAADRRIGLDQMGFPK